MDRIDRSFSINAEKFFYARAHLGFAFLPQVRQTAIGKSHALQRPELVGAEVGEAAAELLGRLIQYTTACAGRKINRPFSDGHLLVPLALPLLPCLSGSGWLQCACAPSSTEQARIFRVQYCDGAHPRDSQYSAVVARHARALPAAIGSDASAGHF